MLHGLEGSTSSGYMRGMAKALQEEYDLVLMNHRSCGPTPNLFLTSYHSGKTDDVRSLIAHLNEYDSFIVIGFSLGGNIALKLGGETDLLDKRVTHIAGISVPTDLAGSSKTLSQTQNILYLNRFLSQLKRKALNKIKRLGDSSLDVALIKEAKDLHAFDNAYTAPIHGFADADDYYTKCSANAFIGQIKVPTLIVNAHNDTFLSGGCYPHEIVNRNKQVELICPKFGGHVGFAQNHRMDKPFWSEEVVASFLRESKDIRKT